MLINIKTSEENRQVVAELTRKLSLGAENIISRIAFAYSLSQDVKLDPNRDLHDSKGKEYKDEVLFGKYRNYYISLICQQYTLHVSDPDIPKYIKMHIDDGLMRINKLFENNPNYSGFDFLMDTIEHGVEALEGSSSSLEPIIYGEESKLIKVSDKNAFQSLIRIHAGWDIDNENDINFDINDGNLHNNQHVAVAGQSGVGKTQFALEFLSQVVKKSEGKVNFIYLDFKGAKNEDVEKLKPFFKATKSKFIDAPHTKFPINPISFVDTINEKNKIMGINKLVDIINSYINLGPVQAQVLKQAIKNAFESKKHGQYPTFNEIHDCLLEINDKPSKLTSVLNDLGELDMFELDATNDFLEKNYYFSLSADLPPEVRFTATFLIINYIYNTFMNMSNTEVNDGIVGIRYVFLIDEAHNVFGQKKAQALLDKILREIRSKGVSVVLLSQGIEEFNQPDVDFSSNCETAFLLDIKDKSNVRQMNKFLGLTDKDTNKLTKSMSNIQKGEAVSNLKEFKNAELFRLNQFWMNK